MMMHTIGGAEIDALRPEHVLSLDLMAIRLGVSRRWLKGEAEARRVPCLIAGPGRYLFHPAATEQALAARASQTVAN